MNLKMMENRETSPSDCLESFFDFDESLLDSGGFYDDDDSFKDVKIADAADLLSDDLFPDIFNMEDSELFQYSNSDQSSDPRSPLNSDSGISDGNGSPFSPDSQSSVPSPPQMTQDFSPSDQVINIDASYNYDFLSRDDPMFAESSPTSSTSSGSMMTLGNGHIELTEAEIVSATHNYCASAKIKEILPLTQRDVSPAVETTPASYEVQKYPRLILNGEEQRLLKEMKITLPSHLPLTKAEERSLKTVRRKIRNKASAQESRKKKKIYIDGLEERVQICTKQNHTLQKKMQKLEKENQSLLGQLRKLQAMVSGSNKPAQAGTCVMVLLLSFTLLIAPNLSPFDNQEPAAESSYEPAGVKSRTLLSTPSTSAYWYSQSQDPGVSEFTPAKARMQDSFLNEDAQLPSQTVEDVPGYPASDPESKVIGGGEVAEVITDIQTIFNQSEGEDGGVVHDGGRFGRKLHILNDEM